jgi:hypothetical protein
MLRAPLVPAITPVQAPKHATAGIQLCRGLSLMLAYPLRMDNVNLLAVSRGFSEV